MLKTFIHPVFGELRAVVHDDSFWFSLEDLVRAITREPLQNPSQWRVVPDRWIKHAYVPEVTAKHDTYLITEEGVSVYVLSSSAIMGKEYYGWFATEVLPVLRDCACKHNREEKGDESEEPIERPGTDSSVKVNINDEVEIHRPTSIDEAMLMIAELEAEKMLLKTQRDTYRKLLKTRV